ncbi:MAG: hypothetical protein J6X50_02600 [Bacilli bacterium]|nr:hypothetical protein [Bacilli bacterium]
MKLRTVLPMLAVATFALAACAPKVDYAKFHELAVEAANKAKDVSYSKVVLDGYTKDEDGKKEEWDKITVKFSKGTFEATALTHLEEIGAALYLNVMVAQTVGESENYTYYAGGSFKLEVKDGDTYQWNEYGLLTSVTGSDSKLTVSYTK